jgi:hypothetical protein
MTTKIGMLGDNLQCLSRVILLDSKHTKYHSMGTKWIIGVEGKKYQNKINNGKR